MFRRAFLAFLLFSAPSAAQRLFPLQEIDDIGELGMGWSDRTEADLGLARASANDLGDLRLEGLDNSGRPWTLRMSEYHGGLVRRVFRGDLDRNGQDDLLIASVSYGNGRCIDSGTVTTLMFDEQGRPTPWQAPSVGLLRDANPPMTVVDLDADGRAEIVITHCEYAEEMSERRWLQGIYEAQETRWIPLVPPILKDYEDAAWTHVEGYLEWTGGNVFDRSKQPGEWPDLQAGVQAPMDLTLDAIIGGEFGCDPHGYYRKERPADEPPCSEEDSRGGLRFSDGSIRRGRPDVVFESREKLDIRFDGSAQPRDLLASGLHLRAVGPADEPTLLWVDGKADSPKSKLAVQLQVTHVQTVPIQHEDKPVDETNRGLSFSTILASPKKIIPLSRDSNDPRVATRIIGIPVGEEPTTPEADPPPPGRYFSRNGQCFRFQGYDPENLAWFKPLENCGEILPQTAELAPTDRFLYEGPMTRFAVFSPSIRTLTVGPEPHRAIRLTNEPSKVVFEELEGRPGEMVAVVEVDHSSYLAQWRLGSANWLVSYDREGRATGPAVDLDFDGELFHADNRKGYVFLVWEEGLPVEAKIVRGRFIWTRDR